MIATLILAAMLAGAPAPQKQAPPKQDPKTTVQQELPKNFETYGKENSQMLLKSCIDAGKSYSFTPDSLLRFCACHVYITEDVITWNDLNALSKDELKDFFQEVTKGCAQLGLFPEKAKQREVPRFDLQQPKSLEL